MSFCNLHGRYSHLILIAEDAFIFFFLRNSEDAFMIYMIVYAYKLVINKKKCI